MLPPRIIDKNTVTASDVTNTAVEIRRIRLRGSRRAEADKPVHEHNQLIKIWIYFCNLFKYSP